jgi:hypothetical protein
MNEKFSRDRDFEKETNRNLGNEKLNKSNKNVVECLNNQLHQIEKNPNSKKVVLKYLSQKKKD